MLCGGGAFAGTREYSVLELFTKLQRRFLSDVVREAITELQNLGLLCNTRYGEAFAEAALIAATVRCLFSENLSRTA